MEDMEDEDDLEPIFGGPRVVHNRWFSKDRGQYFVMIYGMFTDKDGEERYMHDFIPYAQYVLYKEKGIIAKPWEYIYHLNKNWKDDRVENLKIINTNPIPIEVKYPYDPERYHGVKIWSKNYRNYFINLHLNKKYRNDDNLKKRIQKSLNIYIAETEKLKRFLNEDEKVIYIDGDKTHLDVENLKVLRKGERGNSKYPIGEVPFQDYHIGNENIHPVSGCISICLYHIKYKSKNLKISRSKYRYELKLGRRLERNEELVYKDGNHLNDDIDNLTHKVLKQAEHPFEDFYEGIISVNKKDKRKQLWLNHKTDYKKSKSMLYSRYRKQVIEGRIFERWEEVDHKDGNPLNDNDDNLQMLFKKEHRIKSNKDAEEISPKIITCCDGCGKEFIEKLNKIRNRLKQKENRSKNLFCSSECRWNYIRKYGKDNIKYKELIKYICAGTGKEIELAENMRFSPSRFNPDALPFYNRSGVLK